MEQPTQQLDPFALPTETDTRFVMLNVAAFFVIINLVGFGAIALSEMTGLNLNPYSITGVEAVNQIDITDGLDSTEMASLRSHLLEQTTGLMYVCAPNLLIFAVAYLLFLRHPARLRKQKKLTDFPADDKFTAHTARLVQVAGIQPEPQLLTSPEIKAAGGQAFGTRKNWVLRLGGGVQMRLLLRKNRPRFDAIVLHELGHIANGDVWRTYFTQALWVTLSLLIILPAILITAAFTLSGRAGNLADLAAGEVTIGFVIERVLIALAQGIMFFGQIGLSLLVIRLIGSSVLRIREFYADWRAVRWGAQAGLSQILTDEAAKNVKPPLLGFHPSPADRHAALTNSRRLFTLRRDIPLISGYLFTIAFTGLFTFVPRLYFLTTPWFYLFTGWLSNQSDTLHSLVFVGLLSLAWVLISVELMLVVVGPLIFLAYLISRSLGTQLQRQALAEVAHGERGIRYYLRLMPQAVFFCLGMLAGLYFTPVSIFAPLANFIEYNGPLLRILGMVGLLLVWAAVVIITTWMWLSISRFVAVRLLGSHTRAKPAAWSRRILNVSTGLILGSLLLPFYIAHQQIFAWAFTREAIQFLVGTLGSTYAFILIVSTVLLGIVVVWAAIWPRLRKRRCSNCNHPTKQVVVVGQRCENCGEQLAAWLYTTNAQNMSST